ncbi:TetR family transcriptional regulator [Williamsia deligens]|uniref:TetR family transcriptional regulator n=1 Tax=Williamsia deligens TaxID=321325 RepID=A0ABW3G8W6_9NOCA|nr:TetR family transcriptional regulator [Williamsia deligens]MCP2195787.1 transcriptional regulator, TetR family [Williamsia deligens]
MARQSRFSAAQRHSAVLRAFGGAEDAEAVARELGVHSATLYRWAKESQRDPGGSARVRLIRAAQDMLRDNTYAAVTVEAVADRSGVAPRTAFHTFAGKADLFQAAVDDAAARLVDVIKTAAGQVSWPETPLGQLSVFLTVAARSIYETPTAHVLFRDAGVPRVDGPAENWHTAFLEAVAALIAAGVDNGQIAAGVDVRASAAVITGAMRGIHAAVFDGADAAVAVEMVGRLSAMVGDDPGS